MTALERLKRVNTNPPAEGSKELRLAVLVAVLAAALGVLRLGIGGPVLLVAVVVGIPVASFYSYLARDRPGYLRKAILALAALVALVEFFSSASGLVGGGISALQVPLAELFLWVQVLHSLDLPSRRDLLFSLLSSLSLILLGAALSTAMVFGVHFGIWAVAALASLVIAHRRKLEELPCLGPARSESGMARRQGVVGPVALALVAATVTFLALPPTGSTRVLALPTRIAEVVPVAQPGGLSNPTLGNVDPAEERSAGSSPITSFGYFGFSRSLDTAARGRPDRTLVMRVRASRPDFWRGQTFDVWDGRRWTISSEESTRVSGRGPLEVVPPPEDRFVQYLGKPFVQTYYLERPGPNVIFGAYKADLLYLPVSSVFSLSDGTIRTGVELGEGTVYAVVSRRPDVTAELLRSAPTEDPRLPASFLERYTQAPAVPPRVAALAREITEGASTTYAKVRAIEDWMAANTEYTLDVPALPPGADAVEQFLFVDRKGFCEQIGTSLVVMLRSLGIPARLAVGYTPGERNPITGLFEVRASDAHAWAEVYFPKYGWQGFDPTAAVPLSGDATVPPAGVALASYLAERLPGMAPYLPELAALGAGTSATVALLRWRRARSERRRRARERSWADACRERVEAAGARCGRPRRSSETTREYAERLCGSFDLPDLDEMIVALETETFSGVPVPEEDRALVTGVLDKFEESLSSGGGANASKRVPPR
jgi:transglutaminase-like putative cysteine protease